MYQPRAMNNVVLIQGHTNIYSLRQCEVSESRYIPCLFHLIFVSMKSLTHTRSHYIPTSNAVQKMKSFALMASPPLPYENEMKSLQMLQSNPALAAHMISICSRSVVARNYETMLCSQKRTQQYLCVCFREIKPRIIDANAYWMQFSPYFNYLI